MSPFVYCEDESMRLSEMMVIAYGFKGALVERYDETHAILVAAFRDTSRMSTVFCLCERSRSIVICRELCFLVLAGYCSNDRSLVTHGHSSASVGSEHGPRCSLIADTTLRHST